MRYLIIFALLFCCLANQSRAACYQTELVENPTFQDREGKGLYLSLIGGIDFFDTSNRYLHYQPGYYLGGALGYKFANNFKIECEISYQLLEMNYIKLLPRHRCKKIDGHSRSWSYLANILYDFDLNFPINPYIGIGLGYSRNHSSEYDKFEIWGANSFVCEHLDEVFEELNVQKIYKESMCTQKHQTDSLRSNNSHVLVAKGRVKREFDEGAFTWQIIAGISYSFCHNLKLGLEYRFFNFEDKCHFHKAGLVITRSF